MVVERKVLMAGNARKAVASVQRHPEKDGYRVFGARSGPQAFNLIRRGQPDVLLVDRTWVETGGFDLASVLQGETPIIILAAEAVDEEMGFGTESEATDHVVKAVEPCEVLSRVRAALRRVGKAVPDRPDEVHCADILIDRRCHEVRVRGEAVHLTPTEFRLLEVLAAESGRAFTRLELLGRVLGYDYGGLERTVDTHVRNLRKKIEPDPKEPTYVKTVNGVGYKFAEG